MHKTTTALTALAVLCVVALAACGGSGGAGTTRTATVPAGKLGEAINTPRSGSYGGMECTDQACSHFTDAYARRQVLRSCDNGPVEGQPTSYRFGGRDEYFVCFAVRETRRLVNFHVEGQLVLRSALLRGGDLLQTCEGGLCIAGTWATGGQMVGTLQNANGITSRFRADWIPGTASD